MDLQSPVFGSYGIEIKVQDVRGEDGLWVLAAVALLLRSLWVAVILTGESTHKSALKQWSWRVGFAVGPDTEIVKN